MQTDSSASFTYFASRSASECTTTVLMPISRHARWMRRAISPRLAMSIFSNIRGNVRRQESSVYKQITRSAGIAEQRWASLHTPLTILPSALLFWQDLADQEQRLAVFDRLAVFHQNLLDHAGFVGVDFIEQFHGFDDAQGVAFLDFRADFDKCCRAR